jgi:GH15 family glucan-1,4-alpha-glucosidase
VDGTCDAGSWGLFAFGLYAADDPRIAATFMALRDRLWLKTEVGGMARYEGDGYHQVSPGVPGNPWFICTLWLADYLIEKARSEGELGEAVNVMTWVANHALPSGVLAEQVHPFTGGPLSVSPLTWSHATLVATTQRLLRKLLELKDGISGHAALLARSRTSDWLGRLYADKCDAIRGRCEIK